MSFMTFKTKAAMLTISTTKPMVMAELNCVVVELNNVLRAVPLAGAGKAVLMELYLYKS